MWYGWSSRPDDGGSALPTQNHMDHVHAYWKNKNVDPNVVPDDVELSNFGGMTDGDKRSWLAKSPANCSTG